MDFKPFNELKSRMYLKILLTGRSGTGKTRFCMSAQEPIYIIDTEEGVDPFFIKFKDKKIFVKKVYKVDENNEFDSIASLDEIEKSVFDLRISVDGGTIAIDSMTSLWQWMQDWLRFEVLRSGGSINKKGVPSDRRDWAKATSRHNQIIMSLLGTNAHVILTAQNHPIYNSQGQETGIDKPSTQKNAPFLVDVILELKSRIKGGNVEYYGVVKKCRFPETGLEGREIIDPTFDKIYEAIFKDGK